MRAAPVAWIKWAVIGGVSLAAMAGLAIVGTHAVAAPAGPPADAAAATAPDAGALYLTKNKGKRGVVTTASGLQYEVIRAGTGPSPTLADRVKVHYEGRLVDGKVFDSSYQRNEPIVFGVTQVIPGWTEGLQTMKVGGKSHFVIPSDLAYGPSGTPGGPIPPNAVLVFDVELLAINP